MLRQGLEVIRVRGLTVGLEDVRMEDLISAAEVPRSSVWRIWPGKWEYLVDLLSEAAGPTEGVLPPALDVSVMDLAMSIVGGQPERLATAEGRRAALVEVVRVAIERDYGVFLGSTSWRTYVALLATVGAIGDERARNQIAARLVASEQDGFVPHVAAFYELLCGSLGLRLRRPEYTFEHLALAGAALIEGLALREVLLDSFGDLAPDTHEPSLKTLLRAPLPGPDRTGSTWTTVNLAFLGIVDSFVEPDPDFQLGPTD